MIERVSVTNQIIDYMKGMIDEGAWKTGEKIPSENQLMHELGVSRASIRDAIKFFSGQGILESVHGKGTFLLERKTSNSMDVETRITADDLSNVEDVLVFRRIVESEGCRMAASRIGDSTILELKDCLKRMKATVEYQEVFVATDIEFHLIIAEESGNQLIHKTLLQIYKEADLWMKRNFKLFGSQNGIFHHQKIVDSLVKHDPKAAYKAMYDHMQNSVDLLRGKEIIGQ